MLRFINITLAEQGRPILSGLDWTLEPGQAWALLGDPEACEALLECLAWRRALYAGRREPLPPLGPRAGLLRHSPAAERRLRGADFSQQRFTSWESDGPPASSLLPADLPASAEAALKGLGLRPLLGRPLVQLSSGELKRLCLAATLVQSPPLLALSKPLAGLDEQGRAAAASLLRAAREQGACLVASLSRGEELESGGFTHALVLKGGRTAWQGPLKDLPPSSSAWQSARPGIVVLPDLGPIPARQGALVRLDKGTVRYGRARALDQVDWQVLPGERWLLKGPNGSGKSTLLSLVNGDHPQAYANELWLFGRKRGSGESVAEIRRQVGMVGPDLEAQVPEGIDLEGVVQSGLTQTLGPLPCGAEGHAKVRAWLEAFDLPPLLGYWAASALERRLALLARGLIHGPQMLLLDEPCQGLAAEDKALLLSAIGLACRSPLPALALSAHHPDEVPPGITHTLTLDGGRRT